MAQEEKIAHLGFIQGVINRMGNNSFLIKGWAITLVAAVFALSADSANKSFAFLALFPLVFFWFLDAFFVRQEKLYRKLYEKVANGSELSNEFLMDAYKYESEVACFCKIFVSDTLKYFYGSIIILILLFMWKVMEMVE
jgi:hypothetical protein